MFIGHFALGFAAKRAAPGVSLGVLFAAAQLADVPMYLAGLWIYFRTTRPRDATGRWSFALLAAMLLIIYVGNFAGPPPPSVTDLWSVAIVGSVIFLVWSWWADRHRDAI